MKLNSFFLNLPGIGIARACSIGCMFVVLVFMSQNANSQVQTGAINGDHPQQTASAENVSVWAVPAEQKVRPDDNSESENLIWNKKEMKISVAGAANEHIPFQIVITTPVSGQGVEAPDGFFINITDLVSERGHIINQDNISMYLQHYIFLDGVSSPVGDTGYWPDALAPLKVPFSMQARYHVVNNRPVWVDVTVPAETPAGIYKGKMTVTRHDEPIKDIQVEVEVYDFTLPEETALITYINISRGRLAGFYNQSQYSDEIVELTHTYNKFVHSRRMEPRNDFLLPEIIVTGNDVEVTFDDEAYQYYMDELHTKRVLIQAYPHNIRGQIDAELFSPEFNRIMKLYFSQVREYFDRKGWLDKLVVLSPVDEAKTAAGYEQTRQWALLVREGMGDDVNILTTRTPVPVREHPEWGTLRGYATDFSVHGNHMSDPDLWKAIPEEQEKGGEITWYVSCDQSYPQPNYFIDAPGMDPVMIPWITARYGMDGILYWALTFWGQTANPWLNANTFHSGYLCSGGWILNGEGSLLYPGDYTNYYTGQPDVDGPVSSIRFELLREGIEDYVYLDMLKQLGDGEFADKLVRDLVVDVTAFSRNIEYLYAARKAMARRIEELSRQ